MITVNCVVVTYNRLALLKENLQALKAQTFQPQRIIIIDNCLWWNGRAFQWIAGFCHKFLVL